MPALPAIEQPVATAPTTIEGDVTAELAADTARKTASYRQAAEELVSFAVAKRDSWTDDRKTVFDSQARVVPQGRRGGADRARARQDLPADADVPARRRDPRRGHGERSQARREGSVKVALTLAALCCVPALAFADGRGSGSGGAVQHAVIEIEPVPGHPFKELAIENPLGDIRVEGHDGDGITVETWKFASRRGRARSAARVARPEPGWHGAPDDDRRRRPRGQAGLALGSAHRRRDPRAAQRPHRCRRRRAASSSWPTSTPAASSTRRRARSRSTTCRASWSRTPCRARRRSREAFGSIDAATVSSDLVLDTISGDRLVASASKGQIDGRRVRSREIELTTTDGQHLARRPSSR